MSYITSYTKCLTQLATNHIQSVTSSGGGPPSSCLVQLITFSLPLSAATLLGRSILPGLFLGCSVPSTGLIEVLSDGSGEVVFSPVVATSEDTSNGINLAIGRLVLPCVVLILAALTSPSFPFNSSSMTANFQEICGVSSCIRTMSPGLTVWVFCPEVL